MLRLMREKFKSLQWILWAVIISFVLWIFIAWGMGAGSGGRSHASQNTLAMDIDGRQVTRTEFVRQLRDTEANYRARLGEQADQFLQQLNLPEQVANSLITHHLAIREAKRAGISVSDQEIKDYILEVFVDAKGEFIGVEKVERRARSSGYTDQTFKQALADDLLQRKFQALIEAGVVVSDAEVKAEYLKRNDRAKADYVFLDARTLGQAAKPAEADLESFFAANRERFAREERKARYVAFAAADFTAKAEPTEEDLRKEYDQESRFRQFEEKRQARHILLKTDSAAGDPARLAEIKARATALYEQAKAGADFAALAKDNSQDESSAAKGGDLGSFGRGQMVKPFEEAVFAMSPGEVVGPIETQFGFHVIKLEAIEPVKSFEETRKDLEPRVRDQKTRTLAREAAAEAAKAHAGDGKLEEVAKSAGKPIEESGFLREDSRTGTAPGIDPAYLASFAAALFRIPETGKVAAEPAPTGNGFAVLQLADKRGPVTPALADIRERVEEEWKLDQGKAAAAKKAAELSLALAKGQSLEDAAKAEGLELKPSSAFARGVAIPGVPRSEAAASQVWEREVGKVGEPIVLETGTVFVRTVEKFAFDEARFEAEKENVRRDLEGARRSTLWSSLIRSVRKELESAKKIRYLAADLLKKQGEGEGEGGEAEF